MFFLPRGGKRHRALSSTRRRVRQWIPASLEGLEKRDVPAAGPLGLNLSSIDFVDVMKDPSGSWSSATSAALTKDANGWPTSDATILAIDDRVNQPWNGPDPNASQPDIGGTYHISFQGQATIAPPNWLKIFTVQNQTYNAVTNTTNADLVVVHNPLAFLQIYFTNTVNPASSTGSGITNVQMLQPGYAAGTTQVFTNNFLNALKPFGTLRYLNVDDANEYGPSTNNDSPLNWSQRRLPSDDSQTDNTIGKVGVSWEYMIALANASNTDMWINVPGPATDDYVTQLANLIKNGDTVNGVYYAGLNPNLKVYLEYSNEVWGGINNTYAYNMEASKAEAATGTSALTNDGTSDNTIEANRRYLERTMQITNIFRGVLGSDPTYSKIRPVLGWQEQNYQYYLTTFPWFQATYGAPSQYFYGLGDAIYWGVVDYSSEDKIISQLAASEAYTQGYMADDEAVALTYGMKAVSYEGGPSLGSTDPTSAANALAASRDPRMETLVENHYLDWYAAGGDVADFFDGPYEIWSPSYGIWGAAELSQASNPSLSPKYRGLQDVAAASAPVPDVGISISSTYSTNLSLAADSLGGNFQVPTNGQTTHYLLNVASAGNYSLTVSTQSLGYQAPSTAPGSVQVLLDGQKVVGTFAVGQTGTFGLGTFPLHAGLNILVLQTLVGTNSATNPPGISNQFRPTSLTLSPASVSPNPSVGDPSFESLQAGPGNSLADPSGSNWSFSGSAGVAANNSTWTSGNPSAPTGSQVAYLQMTGSISQSVAGWAAGAYQVSFQAAQRGNSGTSTEDFEVLVNNVVEGVFQPSGTTYQTFTTSSFPVGNGAQVVTFLGLDSAGGDNSVLLDGVTVNQVATQPTSNPSVGDSSFEMAPVASGQYTFQPGGTPWSYTGTAGVTANNSPFTSGNPTSPVGARVAFLEATGSLTQNVAGWFSGSYQISFQAAQRGNYAPQIQDFQVLVDGTVVATFKPSTTTYQTYTTQPFTVTAGAHQVTFQGLNDAGGDNTALIDGVTITAVPTSTTTPTVTDPGFESVSVKSGSYVYGPTGTAWTYLSGAGVASNNSAFTSGNPSAPQGSQVAFLQGTGATLSQSVANWSAGNYQISFQSAQRGNSGGIQDFQVLVDGAVVGTFKPTSTSYLSYSTGSFSVSAGSHVITFRSLNTAGGDDTAFVDNVAISVASSVPTLSDPGFEGVSVNSGSYVYGPTGTAWTYLSGAGVASNNSAFTSGNPSAPQGSQVAFLQGTGATLSQSVANWSAGNYQISFQSAQRGNSGGIQDFQVLVDGAVVGTFKPTSTSYLSYSTGSFSVSAGSHVITFRSLNTAGGDDTAFVDNVAISVASSVPTLTDPGFEGVSVNSGSYVYGPTGTAWTYLSGAGVASNNSAFTSGNPSAPQGSQVAFLQGTGATLSQSVANWSAGNYQISFQSAQRGNSGGIQDFQVLVDGAVVGTFKPTSTSYLSYSTGSFSVSAGSHVITFRSLNTAGGDDTAFVDNVAISVASSVPTLSDPGFEGVSVNSGSYVYGPTGTAWTYLSGAGVASNNSAFTSGNPSAPQGSQVAFLQGTGATLSQSVANWSAGNYQISFQSAQRGNSGGIQDFQVLVDGAVVGTFKPSSKTYLSYSTGSFSVSAGSHVITFRSLNTAGGDDTAFLDNVNIASA